MKTRLCLEERNSETPSPVESKKKKKDKSGWFLGDLPFSVHQKERLGQMEVNCFASKGKNWKFFKVLLENSGNLLKKRFLD
ncbi:hypothetical protein [Leptospira interrogans]|uniref:hypothetical protein n=1 Tax=Leptospira interrogans TaxID=173 RepID=UPI003F682318